MTNKIAKKCTVPPSIYSNTEIEEIFHRFSLQTPHPQGELYYTNPFTLLVAVLLSAQTTDTGVNKVTPQLFNRAQSAEEMAKLSEEEISHYIRSIGLWKTKAKNIACLSQILWQQYQGHVPASREELTKLPGVGRKTANVVLNIAFHQDTLAVDTHIFRIANRLQLAPGKTADEVEKKLLQIIPKAYLHHAHLWLILHGRYTCKARRPLCEQCIIADLCKAPIKTSNIAAPIIPPSSQLEKNKISV